MIEINKIYNEDCLDTMRRMPDNFVDLVVTSPPYDGIRDYNGFSIDLHSIGNDLFRILKNGSICAIVINDGTKNFGKSLTTFKLAIDFCEQCGFKLFETIIYSRNGRPGAWWNKRFRVDHEYILLFLKGIKPKYFNKELLKIPAKHAGVVWHGTQRKTDGSLIKIKKTKQSNLKCRGTIWHYKTSNTENNKIKMKHPATFPDKLPEDLIVCFSNKDDLIYDPFIGSGTTAKMAKQNNRNFIGSEISEEYCKIAEERLNSDNNK